MRLVVNAETGEIAQQFDYDGFGQVLQDTNPGFQSGSRKLEKQMELLFIVVAGAVPVLVISSFYALSRRRLIGERDKTPIVEER